MTNPEAAQLPAETRDCSLGYDLATRAPRDPPGGGQAVAAGHTVDWPDGGTPSCPCGCPQVWVDIVGWVCPHCDPELASRGR